MREHWASVRIRRDLYNIGLPLSTTPLYAPNFNLHRSCENVPWSRTGHKTRSRGRGLRGEIMIMFFISVTTSVSVLIEEAFLCGMTSNKGLEIELYIVICDWSYKSTRLSSGWMNIHERRNTRIPKFVLQLHADVYMYALYLSVPNTRSMIYSRRKCNKLTCQVHTRLAHGQYLTVCTLRMVPRYRTNSSNSPGLHSNLWTTPS